MLSSRRVSDVNRNFPSTSMGSRIFTVYIDNLPNGVGLPWLRKFFSNFGMVKDAYLPLKRSKRTGNRFGFVKYESIKGADQAIVKTNGFWIGKKHLIVERASFDMVQQPGVVFRNAGFLGNKLYIQKGINQGEVWEGNMKEKKDERRISLNLQPVAVEWLTRSVVAKLKALTTPELVQSSLRDFKFNDVVVKSLGGLKLIITFQTRADCAAVMGNSVIVNWFNSFKPWNGEVAGESRLIWLKCRGMPLTVWNAVSFKRLGEIWGDFITLDVETLKEESYDVGRMLIATEHPQKIDDWINITVRGKNHRVKIWEEDCDGIYNEKSVRDWVNKQHAKMRFFPIFDHEVDNGSCKMNNNVGDTLVIHPKEGSNSHVMAEVDNQQGKGIITNGDAAMDVSEAKNEDKAVMDSLNGNVVECPVNKAVMDSANGNVVESPVDKGNDNFQQNLDLEGYHINEAVMDANSSTSGVGLSIVGSEVVMDSFGKVSNHHLDAIIGTNPPANSINQMVTNKNTNVALVEMELNVEGLNRDEPDLRSHEADIDGPQKDHLLEDNQTAIQAAIKSVKGKKKRKTINEILGFPKVKQGNKKGGKKCVLLRSAVAAASLSASISSNGINNRNKMLLNEAQAVWEVNKLYMSYDGDEEEVISKIAELRAQANTRAVSLL